MTHAIRLHETGGPEVLRWESIDLAPPGPGEARVRHTAVGLNFIDTYHRSGLYAVDLPAILGSEGAGVVEAVGEGVTDLAVGMRVAYATGPLGAYSEARNVPAKVLVELSGAIDDRLAAAAILKGMTAHYLLEMLQDVQRRDERKLTVVCHAAAGGVGLLLTRWAKHAGAIVIGVVGSAEKAELAKANCDHVLSYGEGSIVERTRELTGGEGADIVYDSVGKDTFQTTLASLRPRGLFVSFGNASGPAPAFEPRVLAQHGSLFFTRPTLGHYVATTAELRRRAAALFTAISAGVLDVCIAQTFPLREAAAAHRALEGRQTVGSTLLIP